MIYIFQSLQGRWALQRKISLGATMQGTALFHKTSQDGLYYYQEQGWVHWNGKVYKACNEYAYRYQDGSMMIHFWDKNTQQPADLLHTLVADRHLGPVRCHSTYDCKQDKYELVFNFRKSP